jgi:hypothetical protein
MPLQTNNLNAGSKKPKLARQDLEDLMQRVIDIAAPDGADLIGYSGRTVKARLDDSLSLAEFGVPRFDTGVVDRTAQFLNAIASGEHITVPRGMTVKISDWISVNSYQQVYVEAGARINQITADKGVFRAALRQQPMVIVDGILHGAGVWSPSWSSNGAHQERGCLFEGCTDTFVGGRGVIRNFGHAQLAFLGGSFTSRIRVEGTHTHGTPIASQDNWQMGVYITDDDTYGGLIYGDHKGKISGVCQGVLRENRQVGAPSLIDTGILKLDVLLQDIPGQHGLYIQRGNLQAKVRGKNVSLSLVKISTPVANARCVNHVVHAVGDGIGSHLFEIESFTTSGSNGNLNLIGVGNNIGGAAISMLNGVQGLSADLTVQNCGIGVQAQGVDQQRVDIKINGKAITESGIAIYSTNSDFKIRPTLRDCNIANGATSHGIFVSSASAVVDLIDPDVSDANTRQRYALFNEVAGGVVRVHGQAKLKDGQLADVRAIGAIENWPETLALDYDRTIGFNKVSSPGTMRTKRRTTSASSVEAWMLEIPDERIVTVTLSVSAKLLNTNEFATHLLRAVFRKNGGVVVREGAVAVLSTNVSGGNTTAYSLASDGGSNAVLLVNSGGAFTYDWSVRAEVEVI